MKVFAPIPVTEAMLTYSSVPENDYAVWAFGTFAVGDRVIMTTGIHKIYECLVAHTSVDSSGSPDQNLSGTTPKWLFIDTTNKWKMFDTLRSSATTAATSVSCTVALAGRINALALIGLTGVSATISISVASVVVYTKTFSLTLRHTTTWFDYYFGTFGQQKNVVMFDVPPYLNSEVTVTVSGDTAAIGVLAMGNAVDIGKVQYSPTNSALNFSTITRDGFGNATLLQRRSVPKTDQVLWIAKNMVNKVLGVRDDGNAVPMVWSGLDDLAEDDYFDAILIFGIYKEFTVSLDYPDAAKVTLQLEEM